MTPTIGFTNKYYTLWNISKPYTVFNGLYTVTKQDYQYIQNLSYDFDTAKQKMTEQYGDRNWEVDLDVRGKSKSFSKSLSIKYNEGVFLFGKYKGSSFDEISDFDYKQWYWNETKESEKFSQELHDELQQIGGIVKWKDEWVTLNDFETIIDNHIRNIDSELYESGHFHTDGEMVTLHLGFKNHSVKQTHYGLMNKYVFVDKNTYRNYFYEGSKEIPVESGDLVEIKGKIKHVSYWSAFLGQLVEYTKLVRPQVKKIKKDLTLIK